MGLLIVGASIRFTLEESTTSTVLMFSSAFLGIFTVPKLYEVYKVQIDQAYDTAHKHWKTAADQ